MDGPFEKRRLLGLLLSHMPFANNQAYYRSMNASFILGNASFIVGKRLYATDLGIDSISFTKCRQEQKG